MPPSTVSQKSKNREGDNQNNNSRENPNFHLLPCSEYCVIYRVNCVIGYLFPIVRKRREIDFLNERQLAHEIWVLIYRVGEQRSLSRVCAYARYRQSNSFLHAIGSSRSGFSEYSRRTSAWAFYKGCLWAYAIRTKISDASLIIVTLCLLALA